jgi:hypothetical protein
MISGFSKGLAVLKWAEKFGCGARQEVEEDEHEGGGGGEMLISSFALRTSASSPAVAAVTSD